MLSDRTTRSRFRPVAVAGSLLLGAALVGLGVAPAHAAPPPLIPTITSPSEGFSSLAGPVTFSGTGSVGEHIYVYSDPDIPVQAVYWCNGTVAGDGTWSCTATLPAGTYRIGAYAQTANLYSSIVTIAMTAPVTFTIDSPVNASTVDTATPTLSGQGEPGGTVIVAAEAGGTALCSTTIADDTTWSCTLPPLGDGYHFVYVRLGGTEKGGVGFTVTVTPTITSPVSGAELAVGAITFAGTSAPGATVDVWKTSGPILLALLCSATADSVGAWECDYTASASDAGSVTVLAKTSLDSEPVTFTILGEGGSDGGSGTTGIKELANTGSDAGSSIAGLGAVLAMLAGAALLIARRRTATAAR